MSELLDRCNYIEHIFNELMSTNSRLQKEAIVSRYKKEMSLSYRDDLDYCFEVLAGMHKLGYTYVNMPNQDDNDEFKDYTIKAFVELVLKPRSSSDLDIASASYDTPKECRRFISRLVNRDYKLGYSNRQSMITVLSPMLAKKYPETFTPYKNYFVQEKLDGNRCIAYFVEEDAEWHFQSRSGKPLKVEFDMSWADIDRIYDGEIMTLDKAGTRDFNSTSGAINGIYTDKSQLHYFIYDIIDNTLTYKERKDILDSFDKEGTGTDCTILKVIGQCELQPNPAYNTQLDKWLDEIVDKGGEGLMLRDPDAVYDIGRRSEALLKYKKVQTMDLRIVGFNEGKGKYEGMIGSFICESDEGDIQVNVAGMSDDIRMSNPDYWIGTIIEVAYFDISMSKDKATKSLRFPRLKRVRDDKDTTSIF